MKSVALSKNLAHQAISQGMAAMDFTQALELASMLAESNFVPQAYRGKPGDCLAAMMLGHDVGLKPLPALQSIAVVNGNPVIWGSGMWSIVLAHPDYMGHKEEITKDRVAVCTVVRRVRGKPVYTTKTFSWEDAQRARLTSKQTYQQYPKDMLLNRARWRAAYNAFADALRGIRPRELVEEQTIDADEPLQSSTVQQETAKADTWGFGDEGSEGAALPPAMKAGDIKHQEVSPEPTFEEAAEPEPIASGSTKKNGSAKRTRAKAAPEPVVDEPAEPEAMPDYDFEAAAQEAARQARENG